jgi:hypothetical protein
MDTHSNPCAESGQRIDSQHEEGSAQSLAQLLADARELCADTLDQFRGFGDLAFMEFDLAVSTLQWWIAALVLFSVCSIMACTFIIAASVVLFTDTVFSPVATMLLLGGINAAAACGLFLCLKILARKMTFRTLRAQLMQPQDNKHVETH